MADPELIYRPAGRDSAKAITLHRDSDWQTGLSFLSSKPLGMSLKFSVQILRNAGYEVRFNGGEIAAIWWTNEPYIEPNSKASVKYPEGHVALFIPDKVAWDEWHQVDQILMNSPEVSRQAQMLYDLRVQD